MLSKTKILISTFLSLSILTTTITANDGLKCSNGSCQINVKKFSSSKNITRQIHKFKKHRDIQKHSKILTKLDKSLQVEYNSHLKIDIFRFAHSSYVKQENEIVEPLTEEEINTIIPAPEKFIGTLEEQELYFEQQREMGIELIEPSLPMPLYYCKNDTSPIYDEKEELFKCIISS